MFGKIREWYGRVAGTPDGKQKLATASVTLLLAAAVVLAAESPRFAAASAAQRQLPIYCVERDQKMASLTFDAAWGNEDTQALIDILGKYNVKATFFVVGAWVDKYPESVKALHDAGHEVMNHSNDHPHMNALSADEIVANVNACSDKIEKATGARPTLLRCPYGEYDDHVIAAVRSAGLTPIQWDVDSLDWRGLSAAEIYERVTTKVQPGSIILFHNAAKHTPEALEDIVKYLMGQGCELVPISRLILTGSYTIDHAGKQLPA